jgi:hypothetical protein
MKRSGAGAARWRERKLHGTVRIYYNKEFKDL